MHIPHMTISMVTNNTVNSYTLQMQTSSEHFSMAIRDIIDHFDWGYNHNELVFIYEKQSSKKKEIYFSFLIVFFSVQGLDLLSDVLRVKNNRQPTIILKALAMNTKESLKSRSILEELRNKADPTKKIIVAITQKSLGQFLTDVGEKLFIQIKSTFIFFYRHNNQVL